jgi:hypothetical protein
VLVADAACYEHELPEPPGAVLSVGCVCGYWAVSGFVVRFLAGCGWFVLFSLDKWLCMGYGLVVSAAFVVGVAGDNRSGLVSVSWIGFQALLQGKRSVGEGAGSRYEGWFSREFVGDECDGDRCAPSGARR